MRCGEKISPKTYGSNSWDAPPWGDSRFLQIACCTYDHFYTPNATKNRNLNVGSFFRLHHLHPYSPIVFFSIGSMGSFLTPWGVSYFFAWSSLNSCHRILCGTCISTCWELRHLLCPWWVFILYTVVSLTTLQARWRVTQAFAATFVAVRQSALIMDLLNGVQWGAVLSCPNVFLGNNMGFLRT